MSSLDNYNIFDRAIHRFAFCNPVVQKGLCEIENDLYKRKIEATNSNQEVFITGLPRAGTTLMLELLYGSGEFSTYTYRNMPFVLAPLLWDKLSGSFRKEGTMKERAHGDGMKISFDSPEAFEEVVWLTHLSKSIVKEKWLETISSNDLTNEFNNAMVNSVRKILMITESAHSDLQQGRYLSKNNANISRLDAIQELFPSSSILVLFRNPLAHISSLANQHKKFLETHAEDKFSSQYMKWIGHYEFGNNFKPINFDGWLNTIDMSKPIDDAFWLKYWNNAYTFALKFKSPAVQFVDFDQLLKDGPKSLSKISKLIALKQENSLLEEASILRSPTSKLTDENKFLPSIWKDTKDIYAELKSVAI